MSFHKQFGPTSLNGYRETEGTMPGAVALITVNPDQQFKHDIQQKWANRRKAMYEAKGMPCEIFTLDQWHHYLDTIRKY